ncbi:MAG: HAD family hydrolase [Coprobacillus cateniformis]
MIHLIEIRNKYHSKASGLKAILTRLEIETENTYFFGDGFNDVEILIWWGILM